MTNILPVDFSLPTSSTTLPYAACSLGFPPQLVDTIYGAAKIYDTIAGNDPDFPKELHDDSELNMIGEAGKEIGTTTGRTRTVNWLNMDKLIKSINMTGSNYIIISKVDILKQVNIFKLIHNNVIVPFGSFSEMSQYITSSLHKHCKFVQNVIYSDSPEYININ